MALDEKSAVALREEEILQLWKERNVFEKSLTKRAPKGEFVFYDGPPFATGLPHVGSLLSSIIKDVVPRYKTMRGYRVPRRWGWDCHGLPIENLIEKRLNLKSKKDIEKIGIDVFNEAARASVLEFADEWEQYVERVGRWVDFKHSYKTMDNSYIESVWWALKELDHKGLLYEGRKVLLYCTHCETPLAKAEIAMDNTYRDITEEAVTVQFKAVHPETHGLPKETYLLAWTTTPWTLPGNVALAVGKDIDYVFVEKDNVSYLVAAARAQSVFPGVDITTARHIAGKELIGVAYEPLYSIAAIESYKGKKYTVVSADFVSTEEGTGIVHTAVMYGEDDFALGQKEKLPMVQLLEANGTYNELAPQFLQQVYLKKAEKEIKEDLESRGFIFERSPHTHSYPHCYRCGTPLIYNAVVSWFINIQKVKSKMLKANEEVTWVPEHLKHGRFQHIVENAPDWTISRNRFWASPLPVWKEKDGNRRMIVGSVEELLEKTKRSGNDYILMRHGQSRSTVEDFVTSDDTLSENHITQAGKEMSKEQLLRLKRKFSIDLIITSPLVRTKETARIAQEVFGLPDSAIMVDERLRERELGSYSGTPRSNWHAQFTSLGEHFTHMPGGAENLTQVRRRIGEFLFEVERRYTNKRILIITHGDPSWIMRHIASRTPLSELMDASGKEDLKNSEWVVLPFIPYPHTKDFDLDLHRPYVDSIVLLDAQGRAYSRTSEVVDCWVESGAMPFASASYPRSKKTMNPKRLRGLYPKGYPGDFIAEYIAQTRTWFYYMHAMGVLLFDRIAFRTVVSTGNILAADGSKMSKSKGNYTDPLLLMDRWGADALRLHLMGSVVMQSEDLQFRDDDVREAHNRTLGILWNSHKFFMLYRHLYKPEVVSAKSPHILDRWIRARLHDLTAEVTAAYDAYDMPRICRLLREFIDDYSTWYLRRSRGRVKGEGQDTYFALATQREALLTHSALIAPIMPFITESIYQELMEGEGSIHLSAWPSAKRFEANTLLLADMQEVRRIVSGALQLREAAGIKIRQPLQTLTVKHLPQDSDLHALIAEEINVKEVKEDSSLQEEMQLDLHISETLQKEGWTRECVRMVQGLRKEKGLTIQDRPHLTIATNEEGKIFFNAIKQILQEETGLASVTLIEGGESQKDMPFPFSFLLS